MRAKALGPLIGRRGASEDSADSGVGRWAGGLGAGLLHGAWDCSVAGGVVGLTGFTRPGAEGDAQTADKRLQKIMV